MKRSRPANDRTIELTIHSATPSDPAPTSDFASTSDSASRRTIADRRNDGADASDRVDGAGQDHGAGRDQAQNSSDLSDDARRLIAWFRDRGRVVVAFSGGVDSSVVLAAALHAAREAGCTERATTVLAVTARSPSVAAWQLELAESIAQGLGVEHRIMETDEVDSPDYVANDASRCFHCKSTLYDTLKTLCRRLEFEQATLVSGTNADDLGDYRPGIEAGNQAGVCKPLAELGIGKVDVRRLAAEFDLANAELPASPCLASRIAYGVAVTPERLRKVEQAESFLRSHGLQELRVRMHDGDLARIEVAPEQIARLADPALRANLVSTFSALGFRYITLDLQGFSSGSMNRPLVSITAPGERELASRARGKRDPRIPVQKSSR